MQAGGVPANRGKGSLAEFASCSLEGLRICTRNSPGILTGQLAGALSCLRVKQGEPVSCFRWLILGKHLGRVANMAAPARRSQSELTAQQLDESISRFALTKEFLKSVLFQTNEKNLGRGFCLQERTTKASNYQNFAKAVSGDGLETGRLQLAGRHGCRLCQRPVGADCLSVRFGLVCEASGASGVNKIHSPEANSKTAFRTFKTLRINTSLSA